MSNSYVARRFDWLDAVIALVLIGRFLPVDAFINWTTRTPYMAGTFDVVCTALMMLWWHKRHSAWPLCFLILSGALSLWQLFAQYVGQGNITGAIGAIIWIGFGVWASVELVRLVRR